MVFSLLLKLFRQKLKLCKNVALWTKLETEVPEGAPLPVIPIAYGLSLVSSFELYKKLY
jgi:hypothetical protein